jgi:phosphotriesterase-related protein
MGIVTTLGARSQQELGLILPHEHIFVDLRTWDQPGYAEADAEDVIKLMRPELDKARQAGVTAIVECTPVGVGRRVDLLKAVSLATDFPFIVPTGVYREPWIPPWIHEADEGELTEWMVKELEDEIEQTGVQAGWVKLSAGDDGMTETEGKVLRAAARAALPTQAVIGSHTIRGRVVREQLEVLEGCGLAAERFIWVHAQVEPDFHQNLEAAWLGAWIEYDSLGDEIGSDVIFDRVLRMLEAGLGEQILLSHDRGWYDPALPGGGNPKPFTYLSETFIPRLRAARVDEQTIHQITVQNPLRAFSRLY